MPSSTNPSICGDHIASICVQFHLIAREERLMVCALTDKQKTVVNIPNGNSKFLTASSFRFLTDL